MRLPSRELAGRGEVDVEGEGKVEFDPGDWATSFSREDFSVSTCCF